MKHFIIICISLICSIATANTIGVKPLKTPPKKVISFANDLYAEVRAEKKLIEIFLKDGRATHKLTDEESKYDDAENIQNPKETHEDGSEWVVMLLHGCNGVFTDEQGVVYFWRLSSPRILYITSQNYESTFLILEKAYPDLMRGRKKKRG